MDGKVQRIFTAVTFFIFLGLLSVAGAREIPDELVPTLIQAMKDEIPAYYDIRSNNKEHFIADNPAQRLTFDFTNKGVEVTTRGGSRWRMQMQGYSFDGKEALLKPVMPKITGARVEYGYEGMTEWYINSPYGLEQGFTFKTPEEMESTKLVLTFKINGEVEQRGNSLVFVSEDGRMIHYKGLQAFDATGRLLTSSLSLHGKHLSIEVDVTKAAYPVTVDPIFSQKNKLTASDGSTYDYFGNSVAISGDTVVIGASYDDPNSNNSGSAYVFVRSSSAWVELQKLVPLDNSANDYFGGSVAISGDYIVIGAYQDDDNGSSSGSAYVFVRNGGMWIEHQKLTASDGAADDYFGRSVAINGNYIVIGAYGDDDNGTDSGSAYVFVRSGSAWSEQQKLTASDGTADDFFSFPVAISGDTVVIGAYRDDDDGSNSGSAYVFVRNGSSWSEQQKLTASDGAGVDLFGQSIAISGDTVVIGASRDDDNGSDSGSAYVFVRNGSSWSEQQKLTASDGAAEDYFGYSVAISGDTAIIGADHDDDNGSDSGSAYVFVRNGSSWSEQQKLMALDGMANDQFGTSVSISSDTVVIGALLDDENGTDDGSAYIYQKPENDVVFDFGSGTGIWVISNDTTWTQLHSLSPEIIAIGDLDGNGQDESIVDFGASYGIWVLYNNRTWSKLHSLSPEIITTGDLDGNGEDDCIIDFGTGVGIYVLYNNTTWVKLHSLSPEIITTGDLDGNGQDDCIIDFGTGFGIWILYNNTNWTNLHNLSPEIITTGDLDGNGQDDCIISFGTGAGVWVWNNNTTWTQLHSLSPEIMAKGNLDGNGQDEIIMDFGAGTGIWVLYNNTSWTRLHSLSSEIITTGDMDGNGQDECIVDFGASYGIYVLYNNSSWMQLHSLSPEIIATGNMDNN